MTDFHKLFIVKIDKMIQNKTGGTFLVVYVIYGSLVFTDSNKTVSCLLPPLLVSYHICNFQKAIKMLICTYTGRFMYVPLCP